MYVKGILSTVYIVHLTERRPCINRTTYHVILHRSCRWSSKNMVKNESVLFSIPTLGQRRTEFKLNGDWKPPFLIVTMDQMYYEQRTEVSKAIFLGLYSFSEEATGKNQQRSRVEEVMSQMLTGGLVWESMDSDVGEEKELSFTLLSSHMRPLQWKPYSQEKNQQRCINKYVSHVQGRSVHSVQLLNRVRLFATPWTAAHQASLSIWVTPGSGLNFRIKHRLH